MHNRFPLPYRTASMSLFVVLMLLFNLTGAKAASVNGGYQSIQGGKVSFTVQVGAPAPTSLIVEHFHAPGTKLTGANPAANKISNGDGVAKWFLKNLKPGTYRFSLSFNRPVNPGSLKLILRYRDPQSGSFSEVVAQP